MSHRGALRPRRVADLHAGWHVQVFAVLSVFAFAWRFVPEINGRSLEQIERDVARGLEIA